MLTRRENMRGAPVTPSSSQSCTTLPTCWITPQTNWNGYPIPTIEIDQSTCRCKGAPTDNRQQPIADRKGWRPRNIHRERMGAARGAHVHHVANTGFRRMLQPRTHILGGALRFLFKIGSRR
jgi:hypothetical protein